MSEFFRWNRKPAEHQPRGERFRDADPFQDKLAEINGYFTRIAESDPRTRYERTAEIQLDGDLATYLEPITIFTSATGNRDAIATSTLRVSLPAIGTARQRESVLILQNTNGIITSDFHTSHEASPREILEPLLVRQDLPDCLFDIIDQIQSLIQQTGGYEHSLPTRSLGMTEDHYRQLWLSTIHDMDSSLSPIPIDIRLDTGVEPALPSGETINHLMVQAQEANKTFSLQSADIHTGSYYFFQQTTDDGSSPYVFERYPGAVAEDFTQPQAAQVAETLRQFVKANYPDKND